MNEPLAIPRVFECQQEASNDYQPVFVLHSVDVNRRANFKLPSAISNLQLSVDMICRVFMSDSFIQSIFKTSQSYATKKNAQGQGSIEKQDVLQFFAINFYLRIVRLPCKYDLWSTHSQLPTHAIANENGLKQNSFKYIWRYISLVPENDDDDVESDDDESHEAGGANTNPNSTSLQLSEIYDFDINSMHQSNTWFAKAFPIINQV